MNQRSTCRNDEGQVVEDPRPGIDAILIQAVRQIRVGVAVDDNFQFIAVRLMPRLLRYFAANSLSREDAEDLVQKTLARVYTGIRDLEKEEAFLGWLFAIARNVRLTAIEQRQRERQLVAGGIELAEELPDTRVGNSVQDRFLDELRLSAVRAAIEELPAQQKQCLLLQVRDELSYEEIAETLRLSLNTVRNHITAAKKSLRRMLAAELEDAAGP
jgi:RNA polymerase sigma-70 factor (ECF subfamily)